MLQFKYTPETWDTPLGPLSDPSPIQEMTMTLSGECVTWEEATREFHNFLRAAGYVIPYDIEWYEDDIDKSGSLGDRQPEWGNWMSDEFDHRDSLQKLTEWEETYRHES